MNVQIKDGELYLQDKISIAHKEASKADIGVARAIRDIKLIPDSEFKNMPEVKKALMLFKQGRDILGKAITQEFNK